MNNTVRVGINMSDIQENTHSSLLAAKNPRDERKEDIVSHQSEPGPRMSQRSGYRLRREKNTKIISYNGTM